MRQSRKVCDLHLAGWGHTDEEVERARLDLTAEQIGVVAETHDFSHTPRDVDRQEVRLLRDQDALRHANLTAKVRTAPGDALERLAAQRARTESDDRRAHL